MHDLVIAGGTVVAAGGVFAGDVGVTGERITGLGVGLAGERRIDASGCLVIPGGVDPHVHLQMALGGRVSSDDFVDGTRAAAHGGTTTIIDFVDPLPQEPLLDALARRRSEADSRVAVDYGLHMTLPAWHTNRPEVLAHLPAVVAAGCATFKLYMAYPNVMLDDVALLRALQAIARAGGRAVIHAETGPVLDELRHQALAEGKTEAIQHASTRPAELEATAVRRAAALARIAGCPLHVFHIGAHAVVEALRELQRQLPGEQREYLWGETCPQYLLLTASEHLAGHDGELYICAPPLREMEDQSALWASLADGTLSMVSTDHCPWTRAEKRQADFSLVPGGVPGIEARLALLYHFGVRAGRISLARWVEVCCTHPATWMGLADKGAILPGKQADIVIFDPARKVTLDPATMHETAGWSPYAGLTVQGWTRTVLLRGAVIVEDEIPTADRVGRFIPRNFQDSQPA